MRDIENGESGWNGMFQKLGVSAPQRGRNGLNKEAAKADPLIALHEG